eukprot:CAMPEP_0170129296 /NCGR_PEP_ID=MMETSP0020_2-20130122/21752_1 /TAXON_ID=98059 /ORGANISM="Dinobryon sp., Strain UTEXLB2267" /LENGTH=366 /DNA_ID=CAMNT_0010363521 /DNA_START=296 /DNA_END=1396 /DNA_ORIENTATION=-
MESEWNEAKKSLDYSLRQTSQALALLTDIFAQETSTHEKLESLIAVGEVSESKIKQEITDLTTSTALRYESAEASSRALDKPKVTAALFLKAQNEATKLAEETVVLKAVSEANEASKTTDLKLQRILKDLALLVDSATALLAQEKEAHQGLDQALVSNLQSCRYKLNECSKTGNVGVQQFKKNVGFFNSVEGNFNRMARSLESDIKNVLSIRYDLEKSLNKLQAQREERKEWEQRTQLTLRQSRKLFDNYFNDFEILTKNFDRKSQQVARQYEDLLGKADKKDKFAALNARLKSVTEKLESAQRSGIEAEKILQQVYYSFECCNDNNHLHDYFNIQAELQGQKEAAMYTKALAQATNNKDAKVVGK